MGPQSRRGDQLGGPQLGEEMNRNKVQLPQVRYFMGQLKTRLSFISRV